MCGLKENRKPTTKSEKVSTQLTQRNELDSAKLELRLWVEIS